MITEIERKLQQRIDKRSNAIARMEGFTKILDTEWLADDLPYQREQQKFDKQVLAELIRLRQENSFLNDVASGDY